MKMSEYKNGELCAYKNVLMMIDRGDFNLNGIELLINNEIQLIEKQAEDNEAENS